MTESARLVIAVDSRQVGQADSALNSLGRTSSTVATAVKGVAAAFGVRELYQATEAYASICSGLMKPDTHLGENARHIEVSDDQATSCLFR
ncbi:hypothetical protein SAMN04490192_3393 [Pseudomonas lundensis]|nr:hypothetical protein SAMN04490192_3393 [Pseudomonas lundensis]